MGVGAPNRGHSGPLHNRDEGGFDRPRALFSGMPIGPDAHLNWSSVYDDFQGKAANLTDTWTSTKDASASVALSSAENGTLVISSAATTDNDGGAIQMIASFLVKTGKKLFFEARVKVSSAADCDMFVGLSEALATNPEDIIAAGCARVGFEINDGAATILTSIDNDTATTLVSSGKSASDATFVRLGFRTDGGSIRFYVDRTLVATRDIPSAIAAIPLSPSFFGLSGSASGTHTRTIDYIMAMQERL